MTITKKQADALMELFPGGVLIFPLAIEEEKLVVPPIQNVGTSGQVPTFCADPPLGMLPFENGEVKAATPKPGRGRPKLFGSWSCQPWGIWVQAYSRAYGCRPVGDGPDLNAARRLAKASGTEDAYRKLVAAFLRDGDRFLVEKRHTLRFCQANLYAEAMQATPAAPKPVVADPENYLAALEGRAAVPPSVGPGGGVGSSGGDGSA